MTVQLTPHFTLAEFAVSGAHPELVVPVPPALQGRITRLAVEVLEPIRIRLDRPMRILSGYRSRALNRAVGGSVTSQHVRGEATDFTAADIRAAWLTVMAMVADNKIPSAGQLIYYPDKGFIHAALASERYRRPTCCIHWPEGGIDGYPVISPTLAAFDALVPRALDPQRA